MDLQRPSVFAGQQTFPLCAPFSIKQQQLQLDHSAREKYFKRQTLSYTTSGRQDRQKPPPLELTEQEWTLVSRIGQEDRKEHHLTHEERRSAKEAERLSYRPKQQPAWLKHDSQALRFFAFYQEPFSGNAVENSRRRFCIISYYLEDGTLSVYESTTDYGETRQGPILKRHRMPRADGSGFVTFTDLKLGAELELYSRVFKILDCDDFTRWFCTNAGHEIGEPVESPDGTFFRASVPKPKPNSTPSPAVLREIRAARAFAEASRGNTCTNKLLHQYLENDRKVLVFHCYWENQQNFGCRTYYKLHYFLSDDSVEIRISPIKNSGCDNYSTFLRRGKLPKKLGGLNWSDYQLTRSEFYTPEDFAVGKEIDVYGRQFHIYDCDEFTRQFYREYLNVEQGREIIPEEKPAQLVSARKEDEGREFRISIRELTDKITVFEYSKRNSGHAGGKFFESNNLQNPQTGKKFSAQDFFVGAEVSLNGYTFRIIAADERTMKAESGALVTLDCLRQNLCGSLSEHELLTLSRAGGSKHSELVADGEGKIATEEGCINLDSLLQERNCTMACSS
ncbi:hypothetical protein, conserved [Eimeria praecox]|uniref:DM10 domain-containing protein n=1 Tax=Eimeria praecox TaxID=51316 RepID=U6G9J7_9EIME|nr:hypothetical protein, conserved [Eimeria praecox]